MNWPVPRDPPCPRCTHLWHVVWACERDGCKCPSSAFHLLWPDPEYPLT